MAVPRYIYMDNNATTIMSPKVVNVVTRWMNLGNPSAEHESALEAQKLMQRFRRLLAVQGGFELEGPLGYKILFTSGGSEGNCHVATAAARAYSARTGKLPHIIVSAVEHQSLLACCRQLARDRMIQQTVLSVRVCATARAQGCAPAGEIGTVDPEALRKEIRPNTCLISVIAANGETGAINDLRALGAIAHAAHIPFHSDTVQLFSKSALRPSGLNLDAFSGSFHKMHGPPGVGFLALRNDFIEGYGLGALVCGTQNEGMRGGTENIPGIAGAFAAYKRATKGRSAKNRQMSSLRDEIQAALARRFLTVHLDDYCEARPRISDGNPATPRSARVAAAPKTEPGVLLAQRLNDAASADRPVLVWIGPRDPAKILPNTLFFAVHRSGGFCNKKARAELEKAGIIVGIGPACSNAAGGSSHVLEALDVPPELWQGVLRVSLSIDTTAKDAAAFVDAFTAIAASPKVLGD